MAQRRQKTAKKSNASKFAPTVNLDHELGPATSGHDINELNESTSLRSVRERRRQGAKNSRGPAFIFGNREQHRSNDVELRFVYYSCCTCSNVL